MTDDQPHLEYVGLMALAWDPLRGDTSGWPDRAFYLDLVRQHGEPVLDVGCGTGRLLLDFLGQGIDIDGVEISAEMLAICRSKAMAAGLDVAGRLFAQPMEAMDLPRRYRTIIVPSSSFQLVVDAAAAAEALCRFHDHLLPGGTLAMPFFPLAEAADDSWAEEADLPDGARIRRASRSWVEEGTHLEHTDETYELIRDGVVVAAQHQVRSPAVRGYAPADARAALETAGFVDLELFHEFTREPLREAERLFSVVAHRPGP